MDKNYTLYIETYIHVLKARTIRIWIYFTCFSEIDLRPHLRTALSNSWGRLVAPIINTLSSPLPAIPDTYVYKQETWSFLSLSIYVLPVLSFWGFFFFYFSLILTPSKCTRNSVFSLRLASFSPSLRSHKSESISSAMEQKNSHVFVSKYLCLLSSSWWNCHHYSHVIMGGGHLPMNTTDGWSSRAITNIALTSFSPSPT